MLHSLEFSWYLVSRIYLFKTFFFFMKYLPSLWYLSCSPWFFESGKHWSYNHRESPSKDTGLWKVLFGNVISLKSTGLLHLHLKGNSSWRMLKMALCPEQPSPCLELLLPYPSWAWHQALLPGYLCLWRTGQTSRAWEFLTRWFCFLSLFSPHNTLFKH